jgi:hypothetical protein
MGQVHTSTTRPKRVNGRAATVCRCSGLSVTVAHEFGSRVLSQPQLNARRCERPAKLFVRLAYAWPPGSQCRLRISSCSLPTTYSCQLVNLGVSCFLPVKPEPDKFSRDKRGETEK